MCRRTRQLFGIGPYSYKTAPKSVSVFTESKISLNDLRAIAKAINKPFNHSMFINAEISENSYLQQQDRGYKYIHRFDVLRPRKYIPKVGVNTVCEDDIDTIEILVSKLKKLGAKVTLHFE